MIAAATLAVLGLASAAPAQPDQAGIASMLSSGSAASRWKAVAYASRIPPAAVGSTLRTALIRALQSGTDANRAAVAGDRAGGGASVEALDEWNRAEYLAAVMRVLIPLHDPTAVPALVSAMSIGSVPGLEREVVSHGDAGVLAVIETIRHPDVSGSELIGGLVALRFAVEDPSLPRVSGAVRAQIRDVAADLLRSGAPNDELGTVLRRTVDLAVALGDSSLRQTVVAIATTPGAVVERGVTAEQAIARVQREARDRLSGVPALPRP